WRHEAESSADVRQPIAVRNFREHRGGAYRMRFRVWICAAVAAVPLALLAQRGQNSAFPGGANPDGSLRPQPPVTRLFTQDAYTEYAILEPGSESFRIKFLPEETRTGATVLVNATR